MIEASPAGSQAALVAALVAIDPAGMGGVCLRAAPGATCDAWMNVLRGCVPPSTPMRRVPPGISEDRMLGGLDLVETMRSGRPVASRGLLAEADGGFVVVPMCERLAPPMRAHLVATIDRRECVLERDGLAMRCPARFGVIAWDEGEEDEATVGADLVDRVAFLLDLRALRPVDIGSAPSRKLVERARSALAGIVVDDEMRRALCATAMRLGIGSIRPVLFALRVARALAALAGAATVAREHAAMAAELVLSPRALVVPVADAQGSDTASSDESAKTSPAPSESSAAGESDTAPSDSAERFVSAAAAAAIPAGMLERTRRRERAARGGDAGTSGSLRASTLRGRRVSSVRGDPRGGARIDLVATLRAAVPWQRLRASNAANSAIRIRRRDFHIVRREQRTQSVAIFVLDASGSSALARLAEAKGAVELLLADCYVRRDQVAVIAFHGSDAELLLPPTRSLVRAKRSLAALPGGGGTPLASAIDAARRLADQVRRAGRAPTIVFLADGRANVARDGSADRARAVDDAIAAARQLRELGVASLLIDIARRPEPLASRMATEMGARYLALPYADARAISLAAARLSAVTNAPR